MFAPSPAERHAKAASRSGILGMQYQLSDDKTKALVEFVAADRSAFKDMLASGDVNVKVFERGKAR